jgi:septum formation protein
VSILVLGSSSPRRRDLLAQADVPFEVHTANVDERVLPGEHADAYLERIVWAKLEAVRAEIEGESLDACAVLVADTSVVCDAEILGKPADVREAQAMIARLAGRTHQVKTRFALGDLTPGAPALHAETVVTDVTFRALFEGEAKAYAETGEGLDKAGAYASQGRAAKFVVRIDGSYTNVVGLPICEVVVALRRLGLP